MSNRTNQDKSSAGIRFSIPSVFVLLAIALIAEWGVFRAFGLPGAAGEKPSATPSAALTKSESKSATGFTPHPGDPAAPKSAQLPQGQSVQTMQVQPGGSNFRMIHSGMTFTNQAQWVAWMKKNNPENYANMLRNQQNWRAQQLQQDEERLQVLGSIDVTKLTPEEREVHESYQMAIARQAELRELLAWENLESLSDAERSALEREQGESWGVVSECGTREREILFRETAVQLGLKRDAAEQLVQSMYDVFQVTGWMIPRPNGQ